MGQSKHIIKAYEVPAVLPLLPVHGAVLMPRSILPIPIIESEYVSLVSDAARGDGFIGIVQPVTEHVSPIENDTLIPLFNTGCAGRVIDIAEIQEGRFIVTLDGYCRFDLVEEVQTDRPYRMAAVDFDRYTIDLADEVDFVLDRSKLITFLKPYFKSVALNPNWNEINTSSNEKLITALAMVCPFDASEKQAILESPNLKEQSDMVMTLLELANHEHHINGESLRWIH
jgi:Lon protease-like protein